MATMIPSTIANEVRSSAESKIFRWFQSASGTEDWIVLHSLGITTHNRVVYGETDFLVLAPNMGLFALEVKGGKVERKNGTWYFTDRYGNTSSKQRGPFDQAKEGIFSIISALSDRLDDSHQHLCKVFFGYGVMFPDLEYSTTGVDEEQWQVFDVRDNHDVKGFIKRLMQGAVSKWESHYGPFQTAKLPTKEDIRYIATLLRGDFEYVPVIKARLRNADEELLRLTQEQYRCLDQLEDNPRCLIYGPAGTGKTLLAIEAVKKAVANGETVALFCFNTHLADWLESHFDSLPAHLKPEYVGTFHRYMLQTAREAGLQPAFPRDPDLLPQYYQNTLPYATIAALQKSSFVFDRIVIDEAQDLIRDSYLNVIDNALARGFNRGHWTMFGDFSMQAIYVDGMSGNELLEKLEERTSFIRFRLTINCRNTKPICKEIETVTDFKAPSANWTQVDGPPVQYITWGNEKEQQNKLSELLQNLLEAQVYPEQITILSSRKWEDSVASKVDGFNIRKYQVQCGFNITFCTIQGFKGLENTVIIVTDVEDYSSDKLMYVGLSRATSGLYVLESDRAKQEYDTLMFRRLIQ